MQLPFVADIKRNALDDGPGIRSTVFFKGCPLSCVWCHNPECIAAGPELLVRSEHCVGCGKCVTICPEGAALRGLPSGAPRRGLPRVAPRRGLPRVAVGPAGGSEVDRRRCRSCGTCTTGCPGAAREIVGQRYTVAELVQSLLRDELLYRNSGGGVTLSGGEPTLYAEYVGLVAAELRARGVHVLVETSGHFEWSRFEEHMRPHVDTVFVDFKIVDPALHERYCGRRNDVIVANIERLIATFPSGSLRVRIPLVPGITATTENLGAIANWLRARGMRRVSLLPYNPLWTNKSQGLGRTLSYAHTGWLTPDEMAAARSAFEGFEIEGLTEEVCYSYR